MMAAQAARPGLLVGGGEGGALMGGVGDAGMTARRLAVGVDDARDDGCEPRGPTE